MIGRGNQIFFNKLFDPRFCKISECQEELLTME
jgi:hypothetical protein